METDIERYILAYPQYRENLEYLQRILAFQADQAKRIEPGPAISSDTARKRWQAGFPLFSGESPSISYSVLYDTLLALRPLLPEGEEQATLDRLLASGSVVSTQGEFHLHDFARTGGQDLAADISANPGTVALLLQTVLTPFYQRQAVPYRPWIESASWRRGICPLCGSEPGMARLTREEGRRILICSLCRSEWPFDRLRCPFCEADGKPQLRHFTVDDDLAHRVDCCDQCHRHIKTLDGRILDYPFNMLAEDLVTAHLDMLAREQGYQ